MKETLQELHLFDERSHEELKIKLKQSQQRQTRELTSITQFNFHHERFRMRVDNFLFRSWPLRYFITEIIIMPSGISLSSIHTFLQMMSKSARRSTFTAYITVNCSILTVTATSTAATFLCSGGNWFRAATWNKQRSFWWKHNGIDNTYVKDVIGI
jgi:hypothetical protein